MANLRKVFWGGDSKIEKYENETACFASNPVDTIVLYPAQASTIHHPPRLISDYYLAGEKKSQNKNFDDHISTLN
jgi:hypothetical protein